MRLIRTSEGLIVRVDYSSVEISPRLVSRFNLQASPIDPSNVFILKREIIPVTIVDELLVKHEIIEQAAVDPGGTGSHLIFTVPVDERWELYRMDAIRLAGATLTVSTLIITDKNGQTINAEAWTATDEIKLAFQPIIHCDEGSRIELNVAAYAGGDTLRTRFMVTKEKAY